MKSCLSKNLPTKYSFKNLRLNVYWYKQNLALNNIKRLICHKINQSTNQPTSSYSLTNVSDEIGITTFYDRLFSLFGHITKYNLLIIDGDMNEQVGENENIKFDLYHLPNRNVDYLMGFSLKSSLSCLNNKLKKKGRGKLKTNTYTYKAQPNSIFITRSRKIGTLNCEVYAFFEEESPWCNL